MSVFTVLVDVPARGLFRPEVTEFPLTSVGEHIQAFESLRADLMRSLLHCE